MFNYHFVPNSKVMKNKQAYRAVSPVLSKQNQIKAFNFFIPTLSRKIPDSLVNPHKVWNMVDHCMNIRSDVSLAIAL
jgi:hypothetical protein